ncbi:18862_t:CDS:2, partial [Racocetra persica]
MSNISGGPDFVRKLFKMLEDTSYSEVVSWGANGDSFVVKVFVDREIDAFTKTILPRHFKHSNFASFVRQLNKYDFHKVRSTDDSAGLYGEQAWEFHHPQFHYNNRDQLDSIKRKTPANRKPANANPPSEVSTNPQLNDLQNQINNLGKLQSVMNERLHSLTKSYDAVVQDISNFKKNMVAQDQLMQELIQYLIGLEAEKSSSSRSFGHGNSLNDGMNNSFIPSEQAQKLINSYAQVSRASFDQMNEISQRAQSLHNITSNTSNMNNRSIISSEPLTIPSTLSPLESENAINLNNDIRNISNSSDAMSNLFLTSQRSSAIENSEMPKVTETSHVPDVMFNNMVTSDNLTVVTFGHLSPKQSHASSSSNIIPVSNASSSNVLRVGNTSQHASNSMRVHRSTFVPVWSVPPKVLLVDDDLVYQKFGSKLLEVFGCSFDIAVDGIGAVNQMNMSKYDLVLMDIVLPKLDGVKATAQIRQFDSSTPIISMTSNASQQDCSLYLSHGMNDVLAKPFDKSMFLKMLENYCSHLVMPNFQSIPRPFGVSDMSTSASNSDMFSHSSDTSVGEKNNEHHDSLISNQIALTVSDGSFSSSGPMFGIMSNSDYIQVMNNLVNASSVTRARNVIENDFQDQRPRKKPKFE